jgi:hypothetical protein
MTINFLFCQLYFGTNQHALKRFTFTKNNIQYSTSIWFRPSSFPNTQQGTFLFKWEKFKNSVVENNVFIFYQRLDNLKFVSMSCNEKIWSYMKTFKLFKEKRRSRNRAAYLQLIKTMRISALVPQHSYSQLIDNVIVSY